MITSHPHVAPTPTPWESFQLGPFNPPRLWVGLWQLSSTAWGSAPASRIREAMTRHVDQGYTAFGKRVLRSLSFTSVIFADLALALSLMSDMVNLSFVQIERPFPERSDGYHFNLTSWGTKQTVNLPPLGSVLRSVSPLSVIIYPFQLITMALPRSSLSVGPLPVSPPLP